MLELHQRTLETVCILSLLPTSISFVLVWDVFNYKKRLSEHGRLRGVIHGIKGTMRPGELLFIASPEENVLMVGGGGVMKIACRG